MLGDGFVSAGTCRIAYLQLPPGHERVDTVFAFRQSTWSGHMHLPQWRLWTPGCKAMLMHQLSSGRISCFSKLTSGRTHLLQATTRSQIQAPRSVASVSRPRNCVVQTHWPPGLPCGNMYSISVLPRHDPRAFSGKCHGPVTRVPVGIDLACRCLSVCVPHGHQH
jgi:hypothetical protein